MGKRYYCDYCDKSFADNPTNRRLHMSGGIHQRNKKAHYEAVRDEREILQADLHKKPCRTFMSTGDCRFGDRCQYSHLKEADKARLSETIRRREMARDKRKKEQQKKLAGLSSALSEWMGKREERLQMQEAQENSDKSASRKQVYVPKYEVAECLQGIGSLPPSLMPPTREKILNGSYTEWG